MDGYDKHGRRYARVNQTKAGDYLEADGDFTCIGSGVHLLVRKDEQDGGLYVECAAGHHFLDGQVQEDWYLGLYPVGSE